MQFYLQASIVEKGVTVRQYRASRWDVILGCIFSVVVAWFIIVACAATLYSTGQHNIENAADAAQALRPLAGEYAYLLFAAGLFNASLFAASILPISTSYAVCEGLGFESGLDKKFHEAPVFYWLYTLLIVAGAGVLMIPGLPLVYVSVLSQVANGVLLPFVLIFMLLLTNDRELMGEHVNSRRFNIVAWTTVTVMIVPDAGDAGPAVGDMAVNDRREIFGWAMYDWANSGFQTTVITVMSGPYLTALAPGGRSARTGSSSVSVRCW